MNEVKPILILSTGRTGTIFISQLFSKVYPQVYSHHESKYSRLIQICTHMHFSNMLTLRSLKFIWKLLKGKDVKTSQSEYFIDANSFLYGLASTAPELYPGLKVVHIIRDPRAYVTSHLNFQLQRNTSFIANRFVPFWQPNPFLIGTNSLHETLNMSRFEKFCWIWNFKNEIMNKIQNLPVPYLRIKFEELFSESSSLSIFGEIVKFIGLPAAPNIKELFLEPANMSVKHTYSSWHDWAPSECELLLKYCGNLMELYGYGNEPEWKMKYQPSYEQ